MNKPAVFRLKRSVDLNMPSVGILVGPARFFICSPLVIDDTSFFLSNVVAVALWQFLCIADVSKIHTVSIGTVPCLVETQRLRFLMRHLRFWQRCCWRLCDAILLELLAQRHSVTCQKTRFLSRELCSCMSLCVALIYCVGIFATPFIKCLSVESKWESVHRLLQPLLFFCRAAA